MNAERKQAECVYRGFRTIYLRASSLPSGMIILLIILTLAVICLCSCAGERSRADETESPVSIDIGEDVRQLDSTANTNIAGESAARVIRDMAGRNVELPATIKKVYSTGQPGVVLLYTLAPEKLLGWCLRVGAAEAEYFDPKYLSLPVLGLMQGSNNTANREEIIKRGPDIILFMTQIGDTTARTADEIQDSMKIPVVTVDFSLDKLGEAYIFLGGLIGAEERAGLLAEYCDKTYTGVVSIASSIPDSERVTVYYAQGTNGLQTAPRYSAHSQVIDAAGGKNVVELGANTDGRLTINMEQLIVYDPDVILLSYSMGHEGTKMYSDDGTLIMIKTDDRWSNLSAVKNGKVYTTPCYPYNWQDMPPSVNRIIGLRWLGELLYPDYYDIDIRDATREFYSLFYQLELTDEQLDTLLENATEG